MRPRDIVYLLAVVQAGAACSPGRATPVPAPRVLAAATPTTCKPFASDTVPGPDAVWAMFQHLPALAIGVHDLEGVHRLVLVKTAGGVGTAPATVEGHLLLLPPERVRYDGRVAHASSHRQMSLLGYTDLPLATVQAEGSTGLVPSVDSAGVWHFDRAPSAPASIGSSVLVHAYADSSVEIGIGVGLDAGTILGVYGVTDGAFVGYWISSGGGPFTFHSRGYFCATRVDSTLSAR